MKPPLDPSLPRLRRWRDRQNLNLELYLEHWITHPGSRECLPIQVVRDHVKCCGVLTHRGTTIGSWQEYGDIYILNWIRSARDSEMMGEIGLGRFTEGAGMDGQRPHEPEDTRSVDQAAG